MRAFQFLSRRLASLALAFSLVAFAPLPIASAQEAAPGAEEDEGRPLDGYLATGMLAGLAMWAVGKTARR